MLLINFLEKENKSHHQHKSERNDMGVIANLNNKKPFHQFLMNKEMNACAIQKKY